MNSAYEDIKKFMSDNFIVNNDEYIIRIIPQASTLIINGQRIEQQSPPIDIIIRYFGEGHIDDQTIFGYELILHGNTVVDYVDSLDEFKRRFINILNM